MFKDVASLYIDILDETEYSDVPIYEILRHLGRAVRIK